MNKRHKMLFFNIRAMQVFALALGLLCFQFNISAQVFGAASDFNLFVRNNAGLNYSDVEGAVAIGGNATIQDGYSIGMVLAPNATRNDLVVGGTLSSQWNMVMERGSIRHVGAYTQGQNAITFGVSGATRTQGTSPIDFTATKTTLTTLSTFLNSQTANGTTSNNSGTLTLTGTSSTVNIFSLTSFPNSISTIRYNVPMGSTVIVNVGGTSPTINTTNANTANFQYWDGSAYQSLPDAYSDRSKRQYIQKVVWNFHAATSMTLQNVGFKGTVLAPNASLSAGSGHIDGHLFVNSMQQVGGGNSDFQVNWFPFDGTMPSGACGTIVAASSNTPVCTGTALNLTSTPSVTTYPVYEQFVNYGNFIQWWGGAWWTDYPAGTRDVKLLANEALSGRPSCSGFNSKDPVLWVDGGNYANTNVWQVDLNVVAGITYSLSFDTKDLYGGANAAQPRWFVAGTAVGTASNLSTGGCAAAWTTNSTTWTATSTGLVRFSIRNARTSTAGSANDFGIDNVSISTTATPSNGFNWSGPNSFTSTTQNPTISSYAVANAGTYTVSLTNGSCSGTNTTTVATNTSCAVCNNIGNLLTNPSFETSDFTGWTLATNDAGQTSFAGDNTNAVCGTRYAYFNPTAGNATDYVSYYQNITASAGQTYNFSIYAGVHDASKDHQLRLQFFNSSNTLLSGGQIVQVDNQLSNAPNTLIQYNLTGTAPTGTSYVRVTAYSSGAWSGLSVALKIDMAYLTASMSVTNATICAGQSATITASGCSGSYLWSTGATTASISVSPTTTTSYNVSCVTTSAQLLTNPSFETGAITPWVNWGNSTITSVAAEKQSGTYGMKTNATSTSGGFGQDYAAVAGETFTLTAWGKVSTATPWSAVGIKFYNSSWTALSSTNEIEINATSFQQYTLTGTAPAGTAWIQVYGWSNAGAIMYLDNFSLTKSSVSNTGTGTVTVNTGLSVNITGTNTICSGSNTTLTASGGGTYLWNTGATTAAITVSPTITTTYTVTVTNSGCTGTASRTVTVSTVTANAGPDISQCYNSYFPLNANDRLPGQWGSWSIISGTGLFMGSDMSQSENTVIINPGNTLVLRWTMQDGTCTATDDITLSNTTSCSTTCPSTALNLNGDLESEGTATNFNLSLNSTPALLITSTIAPSRWDERYGSSVTNTSTFQGAYYIKKTGTNGNPHSPNRYIFLKGIDFCLSSLITTIGVACGKTYKFSAWIAAYSYTGVQSNAPFKMEFSSGGTSPSVTNGVELLAPASTSWNNLNWQRYEVNFTIPNNGTEWADFYFTSMSDTHGILIDDICITEVSSGSNASAGPDVSSCNNVFTMAANTPPSGYTGTWTVENGTATIASVNSPTTSVTITSASGTAATLRWTVTDGTCTSSDKVVIGYISQPNISVNNATICSGNNATLTATGCTGNLLWSNGATTNSITVSPTTTTSYTVTCTPTASANLLLNPGFESATNFQNWANWAGASVTTVAGEVRTGSKAAKVNATSVGGGFAQDIPCVPGDFFTVNFWAKCTNINPGDWVGMKFLNSSYADISGEITLELKSTNYTQYTLTGTAPPNAAFVQIYVWANASNIMYVDDITVIKSLSCAKTATGTVTVNAAPSASITGTTSICTGGSTTLTASGGGTYLWSNAATTAAITVSPSTTTTYTVTVTSSGCTATASRTVTVSCGSVGNYVWTDTNGDGIQNEPAANGINGVSVQLWSTGADGAIGGTAANADALVATTTTANNGSGNSGYYNFNIATSGNYYIKFPTSNSTNILTSTGWITNDDTDSDPNATTGNSNVFTINVGGTGLAKDNPTIDAGYSACINLYGVSVGSCTDVGGQSMATVTFTITSPSAGAYGQGVVEVKAGGLTQYHPAGLSNPSTSSFLLPADGTTGTITAKMIMGYSTYCPTTYSASYTLPAGCTTNPCGASGTIGGTVYNDFNSNGIRDAGEQGYGAGISGVTVRVFDNSGQVATTTTNTSGNFTVSGLTTGAKYRVEFSNYPAGYFSGQNGTASRTDVQVATVPACLYFGLNKPSNYCQDNPFVFIPRYINGNPTASSSTGYTGSRGFLFRFPFNAKDSAVATGANFGGYGLKTTFADTLFKGHQIGATWGLAYNKNRKHLYASTVLRRHTGYGPLGSGGIYKIDMNPTTPTISSWLNLDGLGFSTGNTTINTTSRNLPSTPYTPNNDFAAYDGVGKYSLGGLEVSDDGNKLFVVNLFDRKLYIIDISNPSVAPTAANVTSVSIPTSACTASNGNFRPWALKFYNNKIYVGGVCSGETQAYQEGFPNLTGTIYSLDPSNVAGGFTQVFQYNINYRYWTNWHTTFTSYYSSSPMLTDIEFDKDGSMILGMIDRKGFQLGHQNYPPTGTTLMDGTSSGDILRVHNNNGTFVMENNGVSGPLVGMGGQTLSEPLSYTRGFFDQQTPRQLFTNGNVPLHSVAAQGGLVLHQAQGQVMTTSLSPVNLYAGGVITLKTSNGEQLRPFELHASAYNSTGQGSTGKANGYGDLEMMCNVAPIEIGNYVWADIDADGVQDPTENGIPNTKVQLFSRTGTLVGLTTTNASGEYYFNTANVDTTGVNATSGAALNSFTGMSANTRYYVVVGNGGTNPFSANKLTVGSITYSLTSKDTGQGTNPDQNDNDAAVASGINAAFNGFPYITFLTGNAGSVNHTYDFGFACNLTAPTGTPASRCGTGTVSLGASGCSGGTINWYAAASGGASLGTGTSFTTPSLSTTTTYYAECTIGSCVSPRTAVIATVNTIPTANITGTTTICNGSNTTLTASGGGTYLWSNAATTAAITVSPTATTTYTVTVTSSGCTATASRTVTVNNLPVAAVSGTNVICNGSSTTLTASGGGTYLWSTSATTASITINPTATTTYTVTVTSSGCTATASRTVTVNNLPLAAVSGTNVICNGSSTTLTASGGGTYLWSTSATTASITINPTATTTYTVTVTSSGCTATASRTVTKNAAPNFSGVVASPPTCSGTTANSNGSIVVNATNADKAAYSAGLTYSGAAYAAATALVSGNTTFSNLSNPVGGQYYTVRIFNGSDLCYKDTTVILESVICFRICVVPNIFQNNSFETGTFTSNTSYVDPNNAQSFANSNATTNVTGWFVDAGNWINDAQRATNGSKFVEIGTDYACWSNKMNVGTGPNDICNGQTYEICFDFASFDTADPTNITPDATELAVEFVNFSTNSPQVQRIIGSGGIVNLTDASNNTTMFSAGSSVSIPTASWENLRLGVRPLSMPGWHRGCASFTTDFSAFNFIGPLEKMGIAFTKLGGKDLLIDNVSLGKCSGTCNTTPTVTNLTITPATCTGTTPNNNASVAITATGGDKIGISGGQGYYGAAYSSATAFTSSYTFTGLTPSADVPGVYYTVRIFNGNNYAYRDTTILIPYANCSNKCIMDEFHPAVSQVAEPSWGTPNPASSSSVVTSSTILGGERDVVATRTAGSQTVRFQVNTWTPGVIGLYMGQPNEIGTFTITYDGVDNNATTLNATGLGGISMMNGSFTLDAEIDNTTPLGAVSFNIKVYSSATNWSQKTVTLSTANGYNTLTFDPATFTIGGGTGANFSSVGAVQLTMSNAVAGTSWRIKNFFMPCTGMSLGNRVWIETDNDGIFEPASGDLGADGVTMNLYRDVNNDGNLTSADGAVIATQTTFSGGQYMFKGLASGNYIVEVASSNFAAGGALETLSSTTGNGVAPDPDNNTDNDDNGDALSGYGTVAKAITLSTSSEPTNDGDTDANTNWTVDFGFYCPYTTTITAIVSNNNSDKVNQYTYPGGSLMSDFVSAGAGSISRPYDFTYGPAGDLFVVGGFSDAVHRYNNQTGANISTFVTANSGGLDEPRGLTFGPDGNLYVTSNATNHIKRYNGTTGAFIDNFISTNLNGPHQGILFAPDGNLYVSNYSGNNIAKFNGTTGAYIGNVAVTTPRGMVLGPDGNIYVANHTNVIYKLTLSTFTISTYFTGPSDYYGGINFGPDGKIYVTDLSNNRVRKIDYPTGADLGIFANTGGLGEPKDILFNFRCCNVTAPTVTNGSRCGTGTVGLSAAGCSGGTLAWYAAASGGTSLGTGTNFTTPSITITTTYYVECTINGCTSARTAVVATVNSVPTASISGTNTICTGTSTTLTASGGGTYLWSTTATTAAITVSPTVTTTYNVTVTNASGCTATASRTVTVNSLPTASISGTNTICTGTSTTLTASGGGTYLWSTTATTAAITVSPTVTTTYNVTVTNASGCTATASRTVTVNTPVFAGTATNTSVCKSNAGTANIDLYAQLAGESTGGIWTVISGTPGANFTAATGILNPNGLTMGTYVFRYSVTGTAPCPNDTEDITVTINFCCPPIICIQGPTFIRN